MQPGVRNGRYYCNDVRLVVLVTFTLLHVMVDVTELTLDSLISTLQSCAHNDRHY